MVTGQPTGVPKGVAKSRLFNEKHHKIAIQGSDHLC